MAAACENTLRIFLASERPVAPQSHRHTDASSWLSFRDIRITAHVVGIQFRSSSSAKSESIVGIESNRLVVISDGSVVVAFVPISIAPVPKGETAFGIEPDRLVKIGDGLVIVAFVCISDAPGAQGESALGIEFGSPG